MLGIIPAPPTTGSTWQSRIAPSPERLHAPETAIVEIGAEH
jgi:hypothetical protein